MKFAFLILAHANPVQLRRLIEGLPKAHARFFVHVDAAVRIAPFRAAAALDNVDFVSERYNIRWAGFDMIDASLSLMRAAMREGPFDSYVLMSGRDYPIRSNADIVEILGAKRDHIDLLPVPAPEIEVEMWRLERYFFATKFRKLRKFTVPVFRRLPKRNWRKALGTLRPHAGWQWWALTHDCLAYIVRYVDEHPQLARFFRRTFVPDEMFFHTIVAASPFAANALPSLTFANWKKGPVYPRVLDRSDFDDLASAAAAGKLFARKFEIEGDPEILDLIDERIRGSGPYANASHR